MSAKVYSLIERVQQKYAAAIRYSDRGTTLVTSSTGEAIARGEFETSFDRAHRRFSFLFIVDSLEDEPRTFSQSIRMVGPSLHTTRTPVASVPPPKSLDLGLAALTGVSFGSAHTVPRLLMPEEIGGRGLFEWPKLILNDPVEIDDACHHTISLGDGQWSTVIFVNEATLLVRRIVEAHVVTDYAILEVTSEEQ